MSKEVLLCSAGLDSFLLSSYLKFSGHDFISVYFDLGGRYSGAEVETLSQRDPHVVIDTSLRLGDIEKPDAFIPNRNILLATLAASRYGDTIWIGGTLSDRVNDNNKEVFDDLSKLLSRMHNRGITISSPFWTVYKTEVIKWYYENVILQKDIRLLFDEYSTFLTSTFSCFEPLKQRVDRIARLGLKEPLKYQSRECMNCPACFRKSVELNSIGLFRDFTNDSILEKYSRDVHKAIGYNPRMEATEEYIRAVNSRKIENKV